MKYRSADYDRQAKESVVKSYSQGRNKITRVRFEPRQCRSPSIQRFYQLDQATNTINHNKVHRDYPTRIASLISTFGFLVLFGDETEIWRCLLRPSSLLDRQAQNKQMLKLYVLTRLRRFPAR